MSYNPARARRVQYPIAAAFLVFGAWCFTAPESVAGFLSPHASSFPVVNLAVGALGAHAIAAGLFAALRRFNAWTFPGFALSLAPVLLADWQLYAKTGAFGAAILLHGGALLAIGVLCLHACVTMLRAERAAELAA